MEFKTWLENQNVSQQFDQIMQKTWGCGGKWFKTMFCNYICHQPAGRTLTIKLFPSHPIAENNTMAEINFYQEVPNQSNKDASFEYQANQSLQSGTLEFLRKLKQFVTAMRSLGIWIQYTTESRRDELYNKVITQAGYTKADIGVYKP